MGYLYGGRWLTDEEYSNFSLPRLSNSYSLQMAPVASP